MDWLIAAIPIFSFGILPVLATKIGGRPVEQSMGVAVGSMIFALILFVLRKPELNFPVFLISFLSGIFWAVGSVGQFMGLSYLGVSKSTPLCNGAQIIGTALLGVILGNWATVSSKLFGFGALLLIITGILFTSYKEKKPGEKIEWKKGILVNLMSALGFTCYVGILRVYNIDGWSSILPQSFGQIFGILLISLIFFRTQPFTKISFKNSITGIIWAVGNIALLLSQAKIGLAEAYPVSQASIIVSVLGGVFINKEYKNRKEWISTITGMLIIIAGLCMIYLSSLYDSP